MTTGRSANFCATAYDGSCRLFVEYEYLTEADIMNSGKKNSVVDRIKKIDAVIQSGEIDVQHADSQQNGKSASRVGSRNGLFVLL